MANTLVSLPTTSRNQMEKRSISSLTEASSALKSGAVLWLDLPSQCPAPVSVRGAKKVSRQRETKPKVNRLNKHPLSLDGVHSTRVEIEH